MERAELAEISIPWRISAVVIVSWAVGTTRLDVHLRIYSFNRVLHFGIPGGTVAPSKHTSGNQHERATSRPSVKTQRLPVQYGNPDQSQLSLVITPSGHLATPTL